MTREYIERRVLAAIGGLLDDAGKPLPALTASFVDIGFDELDIIELVITLEDEFYIKIEDDELDLQDTVSDLVTLVCDAIRSSEERVPDDEDAL